MPINRYYKGHGRQVMRSMKKRYGKRAKNVFYATVNKQRTKGTKAQKRAQPKRAPGSRRRTRRTGRKK